MGTVELADKLWRVSVVHNGTMQEHGGWDDLAEAKRTVEHFAEKGKVAAVLSEAAAPPPCGVITQPRVVGAANAGDVMVEQLEFLIEHAQGGDCGCPLCGRYHRVRVILLEVFKDH